MSNMKVPADGRMSILRALGRRAPCENAATMIIAAGVVLVCQPFLLTLYTYSFATILVGTVMFMIVRKLPD